MKKTRQARQARGSNPEPEHSRVDVVRIDVEPRKTFCVRPSQCYGRLLCQRARGHTDVKRRPKKLLSRGGNGTFGQTKQAKYIPYIIIFALNLLKLILPVSCWDENVIPMGLLLANSLELQISILSENLTYKFVSCMITIIFFRPPLL